jgi:hypothetical protein
VTLALGSALAYAGVAAYAVARAHQLADFAGAVAGVGAALLLGVLARGWVEALPWALALGGGGYAVSIGANAGAVDEAVPLVAAGLLICGELAAWSLDERVRIVAEPAVRRRRVLAVALLGAGGLASAALVVAVAAAPAGGGLAWTTLGALAAVGAVALVVVVARRTG